MATSLTTHIFSYNSMNDNMGSVALTPHFPVKTKFTQFSSSSEVIKRDFQVPWPNARALENLFS